MAMKNMTKNGNEIMSKKVQFCSRIRKEITRLDNAEMNVSDSDLQDKKEQVEELNEEIERYYLVMLLPC